MKAKQKKNLFYLIIAVIAFFGVRSYMKRFVMNILQPNYEMGFFQISVVYANNKDEYIITKGVATEIGKESLTPYIMRVETFDHASYQTVKFVDSKGKTIKELKIDWINRKYTIS